MKLEKLYRKNQNGKVSFIEMYSKKDTGKDTYSIYTTTGIIGQPKKSTSKITIKDGKNKGKSNETTIKQQCEKEMLSTWKSLFSGGYKLDYNAVLESDYNTFEDGSQMPMLLDKYKGKFKPCYAQRKYDGVRCITERLNGEIRLKSREGKVFNLPHILEAVKSILDGQVDQPLDGELYIHGVELHELISMVKTGDLNQKLEYHIYDVPVRDLSFAQRRNLLLAITTDHLPNIKIDHGKPCSEADELQEFHKDSLDLGYEGTIVCDPNGKYDFGFRTSGKTKIKPRVTEEFECIDQYWNRGKMSKQTTLICKTKEGETFHVKLKGTAEQREEWAANFETDVKGKMITVEYRKKTKKQVPIEGVGVAIRDYE